uniref:DnaJ (Hsp40) homolog, subfamily C, member 27 n=1 Tax=Oncorhynchus kisutch TaxID=8019 RepID=A0A8C7F6P7_ONCKI
LQSCIIKTTAVETTEVCVTVGCFFFSIRVQVRDREIKVNIFDMAGHPFFYEVRNEFYKDSQGVVLVYDVGLRESFDALDKHRLRCVCQQGVDLIKRCVVDEGVGRLWAESRGFHYLRLSNFSDFCNSFQSQAAEYWNERRPNEVLALGMISEIHLLERVLRMGVAIVTSEEEVNKAYRKLAVLLHPDKCAAPGSEDAFKAVVNARTSLLKNIK